MILFLQYSAGGMRGGERYTKSLHSFMKRKYKAVEPLEFQPRPADFRSIVRHSFASLKLVKAKKPSLLILDVSSGARNILAARWAQRKGIRLLVIIQERRMSYRYNTILSKWLIRRLEDYLIGLADILLVNSRYIAKYAKERAGKRANIIICYPGLEMTCGNQGPDNSSSRGAAGILNLLAVGECTEPRKGVKYLLMALNMLPDLNPLLHLAGEFSENNPHFHELKGIIDRYNLRDRVIFHGFLDRLKLSELYRQADIFVLPSLSEGYGMALAESLSFGLPIVASNVAAIPEMVEDGINALLVRPKDPQALASAIRKLAEDSALRNRMRQANRARATTLPTWNDFDATLERELVPVIEKLKSPEALSDPDS
jgi:glycosyltransferase involved in cell wall biosynthesis